MIKLDIINEVVNKTGITKTKAELAVETVFESMKKALARASGLSSAASAYSTYGLVRPGSGAIPAPVRK